jgi:CRP-like cAMP-binding protein
MLRSPPVRITSAQYAGTARLLCLSGKDFRRFLEAQPRLKSASMETITRRLRKRLEQQKSLESRKARIIYFGCV